MEENAIAGPSQSNDSEPPELSNSDSETTPTDPLTSAPTQSPICSICVKNPAKYTCPRCSVRTCSLPCSQTHKTQGEGCSGVRNKAAYVPMNQYGYMSLMNDYTFLEDVGRQVAEWGREIVQGGYSHSGENSRGGRGRGRGRGRGIAGGMRGGVGHAYAGRNKRETLKMEMDFRDIEIDMLPAGMERRTLNQSTWDIKYVADVISACISFHNDNNFSLDLGSHQANLSSLNPAEKLLSYRPRGRRNNPPNRHPGAPHA